MFSWDDVAMRCYGAYAEVTDWKNYQGNPMPQWEELPDKTQEAWIAASKEASRVLKNARLDAEG